jgi:hypothetical protein
MIAKQKAEIAKLKAEKALLKSNLMEENNDDKVKKIKNDKSDKIIDKSDSIALSSTS